MRRLARLLSLLIMLSGIASLCCMASHADPQLPPLTGRVVDQAGLLDGSTVRQLDDELAQYEAKTSTQIVVVTLQDLQGYPIEQWGLALLRGWRIGQKDKNNGVVLVIAPKDHELRIETGYGAEGPLPDATADAIIRHVIVPHFKQNDYSGGISAGIASIEAALEGSFSAPADSQSTQANSAAAWPWPAFLIGLLWLVIVLFNVLRRAGQGGTRLYTRQRRGPPYWGGGFGGGGLGGGGFGGGFGGGGFGGGGGTGGGGGASGSW